MKTSLHIVLVASLAACLGLGGRLCAAALAEDIGLFDRHGSARAYIAMDDDATVYLYDGAPMAYLVGENVYGFNGKHLGWYVNGFMYDRDGRRVGATTGGIEPAKAPKQAKPIRGARETARARPVLSTEWSLVDFRTFLRGGRD